MSLLHTLWFCLLFSHGNALGLGSKSHHNKLMAEFGMLPDGSAMSAEIAAQVKRHMGLRTQYRDLGRRATNDSTENIVAENVTLPLDHFSNDTSAGTFENRFWAAQASYKPGSPVFIFDAGETNAELGVLARLKDSNSFFKQIVDKFNGIGIVWEHRYYGASTPVNISQDTPLSDFKYLTAEQALADIPAFAAQFSRPNISYDLTPSGTPWVFVGGSYPGMRAAFARNTYPDSIYASFASSAPVEARIDMSVYFEPIWRGLHAYGFTNCTADVHAAILAMDEIMDDPFTSAALKESFLGNGAGNNSNAGFADALSTPFFLWQSYGVEGGDEGLRQFCDWLSTDPETNQTSDAQGWAAVKGANFTIDRWRTYPNFVSTVNENLYTSCIGPNPSNSSAIPDCNLEERSSDPSSISWMYQYCTQWGFLQYSNVGPTQLISKYNDLQHQIDVCMRQWPDAADILPAEPEVNKTNAHFGGWTIRPSNTYWSGGEFDPWRTLSPLSTESFAPNYTLTQEASQCDVSTDESTLFASVMQDAEHCFDFLTTFPAGADSRALFTGALSQWLDCWKPSTNAAFSTRRGDRKIG